VQGEQLTEKTDLFSAGIVLFELFKGFNPFLGGDINESFNKILEYDDNKIAAEISDLPDNYKIILETLLKKEPSQRFKAAQSVLELLSFQETISVDKDEREPERKKVYRALFIAGILILSIVMLLLVSMEKERTAATEQMKTDSTKIMTGSDTPIWMPEKGNLNNVETTTSKNNSNSNAEKNADVNKVMAEEIKINEGELYIECLPWANVYINSTHVETTPISKNIVLPTGKYSVKLSHPEYPEYKAEVNIKAGETTNLSVNLESLFGYIDCKIYPWADVYINGTKKGSTPFQSPIKIAPGNYLMTIKNPKFKTKSKSITVIQGETLIIEIDLTSD